MAEKKSSETKTTKSKTKSTKSSGSAKSTSTTVEAAVKKQAKKAAKKASKNPVVVGIVIAVIAAALVCLYIFKPAEFKILANSAKTAVVETVKDVITKETASLDDLKEVTESEISGDTAAETETASSSESTSSTAAVASASSKSATTDAPDVKPSDPENSHMFWGNPSDATKDVKNTTNYLMVKDQYALSYNCDTCNPNWVMWHLGPSDLGSADRSDDFRPDENLPSGYYGVVKADYQYTKYGFDRGHVCPSADRTSSQDNNSATFYMTNMMPQSPDCNRVVWKDFEAYERGLVASSGKELYVVAGPYGVGGESAAGKFDKIVLTGKGEGHEITVPAYCWKIVLILDNGDKDFSRVTKDSTVIALWMPNAMGIGKNGSWEQYLTSVDYIETQTGYDFLECIPNDIEDVLEARVYTVSK